MKIDFYKSNYCKQHHCVKTGKPINHKCIIIPIGALKKEIAGRHQTARNITNRCKKRPHEGIQLDILCYDAKYVYVSVWDKGAIVADRYSIVIHDSEYNQGEYSTILGLSNNPEHPQGFSMWCTGTPGKHLGEKISFTQLPENVQKHVKKRFSE